MAHFAELDSSNTVIRVLVIDDIHEKNGEQWCKENFGGVDWKQTSYNKKIRKNFASVGYQYNLTLDAFIPPKIYDSWVLNIDLGDWEPPIPRPSEPGKWSWDEENLCWTDLSSQINS